MTPLVSDPDFTLYVGDVRDVLRELEPESVHCAVTSPPYWGLRDYGTGQWEGGEVDGCDHVRKMARNDPDRDTRHTDGRNPDTQGLVGVQDAIQFSDLCGKCGARRVDRQLGLEPTPEEYVANMVEVFREVRRVLRADGTCWVNLGDSYVHGPSPGYKDLSKSGLAGLNSPSYVAKLQSGSGSTRATYAPGLKPKDLVGIPWRVAFALQADGWYLRSDIIWSKPNPMPESVTDRPTKAHEYVFLLTKSPRYFFDQEAVREPNVKVGTPGHLSRGNGAGSHANTEGMRNRDFERAGRQVGHHGRVTHEAGRNLRSVWEIPTQPYPEAHFATFPQALVERCLKAGCPEGGTALDPFLGSGTTALVARRLGRKCIGIELNPTYAELAAKRLSQLSLLA